MGWKESVQIDAIFRSSELRTFKLSSYSEMKMDRNATIHNSRSERRSQVWCKKTHELVQRGVDVSVINW